jgi:hypothetical protein
MIAFHMKVRLFDRGYRAISVVSMLVAMILAHPPSAAAQIRPPRGYHEVFVSPDVNCHQGYATDGTNHYTFDTQAVYKWRNDEKWSLLASNTTVFAGITGLSHLGDGDYFEGKLYVVAETWAGCTNFSNQSIVVFDAATLARLEVHDVSPQHHEVSGLAIAPFGDQNCLIYVTSYCDGSKIFMYDLQTFHYLGFVPLSRTLSDLQGIAWHEGRFYVPEDGGAIYTFTRSGKVSWAYQDKHKGSHEGLKFAGDGLRWLIDEGTGNKRIHFIAVKP